MDRVAKVFGHKNCISLNNEPWITTPILINLNSNELYYYLFVARLNRCSGSCNSFHELSSRRYISNIEDDVNLNVFNMITRKNESKIVTKHVS